MTGTVTSQRSGQGSAKPTPSRSAAALRREHRRALTARTMWQTKRHRAILPSSSYASTNAAVESSTMGALLVLLVLSTMLVRIERDQAMLEQLLSLI